MALEVDLNNQLPLLIGLAIGLLLGGFLAFAITRWRCLQSFSNESGLLQERQQQQRHELEQQLLNFRERSIRLEAQLEGQSPELDRYQQQTIQMQQQLATQAAQLASLNTELEHERKLSAEKLTDLQQARQQLAKDFELLANRIFDEKTERFNASSKNTLDSALSPLREQLTTFKKKVEDVYDRESRERISLGAELDQLKKLNLQMSNDAIHLTNALKGDNKTQGNWGEVILERVLEDSGLHKGREYETQISLKSDQGHSRPDVIIRLPENRDIIIDAKVSLVHYERYSHSETEVERKQALKDHVASVREHIKGLSNKNYENLEGLRTLDFVFIFIPIESAFMAAFEHDQAMFRNAYEKNIIVVGPTTLLATLRTVQSIWRYERQNKHAEEIARRAGAMHDKFVGFITDLDKIADSLDRAHQAHNNAMNKLVSGKGNLVNSTQRLQALGAKVKKTLPDSVTGLQEQQTSLQSAEDAVALETIDNEQ